MSSSSTSNRNLILGGLAAVAAGLGFYLWYRSGRKVRTVYFCITDSLMPEQTSDESTAVVPCDTKAKDKVVKKKSSKKMKKVKSSLTRENLISLFTDITRSMQAVVVCCFVSR